MTRIEAVKALIDMANTLCLNPDTPQGMALKMAIKALEEQESVLDKIRAEIAQAADKQFQIAMGVTDLNERYTHIQMENAYRHSLNIIDKYAAEVQE